MLSKIGSNQNSCYLRENWPWFDVINQKKTAMKIILFCTWKSTFPKSVKSYAFLQEIIVFFELRSSRVFCIWLQSHLVCIVYCPTAHEMLNVCCEWISNALVVYMLANVHSTQYTSFLIFYNLSLLIYSRLKNIMKKYFTL